MNLRLCRRIIYIHVNVICVYTVTYVNYDIICNITFYINM